MFTDELTPVEYEDESPNIDVVDPEIGHGEKVVPELTDTQRSYRLDKAEKAIEAAIAEQKHAWVSMYRIMQEVENNELWKAKKKYRSFTAWEIDMAAKFGVQKRQLDDARAAGRFYDSVRMEAAKKGVELPKLEETPAAISPVTLRDAEKWSRSKGEDETASLVGKIASGDLKRREMSKLWKDEKKSGNAITFKSRHAKKAAAADLDKSVLPKDPNDITISADLIKQILKTDASWLPAPVPVEHGWEIISYKNRKTYAGLDEFRIRVGKKSPDRVDVMSFNVVETLQKSTNDESYDVCIHGIEIKVSPYDLINDNKFVDYAASCDDLWLCIPDAPKMIESAKNKWEECGQCFGVLVVNQSTYTVTRLLDCVHKLPSQGKNREETLATALIKLIGAKKVITPQLSAPLTED